MQCMQHAITHLDIFVVKMYIVSGAVLYCAAFAVAADQFVVRPPPSSLLCGAAILLVCSPFVCTSAIFYRIL